MSKNYYLYKMTISGGQKPQVPGHLWRPLQQEEELIHPVTEHCSMLSRLIQHNVPVMGLVAMLHCSFKHKLHLWPQSVVGKGGRCPARSKRQDVAPYFLILLKGPPSWAIAPRLSPGLKAPIQIRKKLVELGQLSCVYGDLLTFLQ